MNKLRIFLDADEVLVDFITPLLEKYNHTYSTSFKIEDVLDWDLNKIALEGTNFDIFIDEEDFFSNLKPYPDSFDILKKLIEDGHDVFIATAGKEETYKGKMNCFKKYFPFMDPSQIVLIKRKDILYGDILLDDAPHNISTTICKNPIIMDKPWNRHLKGPRVKSLTEFYEVVKKISNK